MSDMPVNNSLDIEFEREIEKCNEELLKAYADFKVAESRYSLWTDRMATLKAMAKMYQLENRKGDSK